VGPHSRAANEANIRIPNPAIRLTTVRCIAVLPCAHRHATAGKRDTRAKLWCRFADEIQGAPQPETAGRTRADSRRTSAPVCDGANETGVVEKTGRLRSPTLRPAWQFSADCTKKPQRRASRYRITSSFPWHDRSKTHRSDEAEDVLAFSLALDPEGGGLTNVRFHDGRHTAITTLPEKGLPDFVIQAQVGHVAPEMMKPTATSAAKP